MNRSTQIYIDDLLSILTNNFTTRDILEQIGIDNVLAELTNEELRRELSKDLEAL